MSYHWDTYGVCICGKYKEHAWKGDKFFISSTICPYCGTHKDAWDIKILRKVSTSIWYKPWTWFTGYWIDKVDVDKLTALINPET